MLIHYGEVVDDADEMAMIDHEKRVYLVLAEHLLYRGELGIGADGLGICRHGLTDSDIDKVGSRTFYGAADVAVGDDAEDAVILHDNTESELAAADGHERIGEQHGGRHDGEMVGVHDISHLDEELATERACWVELRKVLCLEVTCLHEGYGYGIAHGHGSCGAGRRGKIEGAGFSRHPAEYVVVGVLGEERVFVACHRHDGHVSAFEGGGDAQQFVGIA